MSHDGDPTAVVYLFLRAVLSLFRTFGWLNYIFCWDHHNSIRRRIYPGYKNRPPKSLEEQEKLRQLYAQIALLRDEIIPAIGWRNSFQQGGREADDLIASIVINSSLSKKFHVVSSDHDLYQLLDWCDLVRPGEGHNSWRRFKKDDYQDAFGNITPQGWARVKAIAGCSSDTIPGIQGVGEVKAVLWLKGGLRKGKLTERIDSENGQAIIKRNLELVTLPIRGTVISKLQEDDLNFTSFKEVCEQLGMLSFLKGDEKEDWLDLLQLRTPF